MTFFVNFSGDVDWEGKCSFWLGPGLAWESARDWAASLDAEMNPRIADLFFRDRTTNTMELGAELEAAMEEQPPDEPAATFLRTLYDAVGTGDEGETAVISDEYEDDDAGADDDDETA